MLSRSLKSFLYLWDMRIAFCWLFSKFSTLHTHTSLQIEVSPLILIQIQVLLSKFNAHLPSTGTFKCVSCVTNARSSVVLFSLFTSWWHQYQLLLVCYMCMCNTCTRIPLPNNCLMKRNRVLKYLRSYNTLLHLYFELFYNHCVENESLHVVQKSVEFSSTKVGSKKDSSHWWCVSWRQRENLI